VVIALFDPIAAEARLFHAEIKVGDSFYQKIGSLIHRWVDRSRGKLR